jgi:hypothetical protein
MARILSACASSEIPRSAYHFSPQAMSYVLPLLIQEGFCTVSDRKPFVIHKK